MTLLATLPLLMANLAPQPSPRIRVMEESLRNRFSSQVDTWFDNGDYPRCMQLLKIESRMYPTDYDTLTNYGFLAESAEFADEAFSNYVWFMGKNPHTADGPYPLAEFFFRNRAYVKVPKLLEPTLGMHPHANTFRVLAHSYERLGYYKEAIRIYEQFIKLYPNDLNAKRQYEGAKKKLAGKK